MDELTEQLASGFAVSNEPNSTAAAHPRYAQYKSRTNVLDQGTRRQRILKAQKKQRFDYLLHVRCLSEESWDKADAESVASNDSMEIQVEEEDVKFRKPGKNYRNQLMMSEWLVEVPSDFAEEWRMVVCPWGKRCLVVASRGKTCAYARSGYRVNTFSSHLPGGSKSQPGRFKDNSILDCLYNEADGTYYILDVMCWKGHPVYDSETEFRFYWLQSKLGEYPELSQKSDENTFKFIGLPNFACTEKDIGEAVNTANFEIDGVLFYHKRTHYTFGSTPLVVWLKPYMLPEILNIQVADKIMSQRPDNYSNYAAHMENVAIEKEKAREARESRRLSGEKKGGIKILQRVKVEGEATKEVSTNGGGDNQKDQQSARQDKGGRRKGRGRKGGVDSKMDVMFSEWMTEVPDDLANNWITVVCPKGKRNLVIAAQGRTYTQNKQGYLLDDFSSFLPGGYNGDRIGMTVLDCIFNRKDCIFYVLDVLFWKEQEMTECDSEFRFFWMKERMCDINGLSRISPANQYKFIPLPSFSSTKKSITKAMTSVDFEIDGVLFYHKNVTYTPGISDFVLWLKPYMLPEALGIQVHRTLAERPKSYKGFAEHVAEVEEEKKERKKETPRQKGRRKQQGAPLRPSIDIDKISMEIEALNINKKEVEEAAIGPVHPRNMTNASVWKTPQNYPGNRNEQGILGDYPWDYYGYGYDNYGWNGYDSGQGWYEGNEGWGFEGPCYPLRPMGRGAMLQTMQNFKRTPMDYYKKTHQTFKK